MHCCGTCCIICMHETQQTPHFTPGNYSDKGINGHLILLQLREVQSYWRALGEAAGLDTQTLDTVSMTLTTTEHP